MQASQQLSKRDERREMQKLMDERYKRTPGRRDYAWLSNFWINRRSLLT